MISKRSGVGASAMALYLAVLSILGHQRDEAAYWTSERNAHAPLPLSVSMCWWGDGSVLG